MPQLKKAAASAYFFWFMRRGQEGFSMPCVLDVVLQKKTSKTAAAAEFPGGGDGVVCVDSLCVVLGLLLL